MSGSGFRGRGFGPRGVRSNGPANGFVGPRFPHPNFSHPRPPPNRPSGPNWLERPAGFPPWQNNNNFPQRPQYRGNFRPNGRGRPPNGRGIVRFAGPNRPPGPQFFMGLVRNNRPRTPFPEEDHGQEKTGLVPQVPPLGSKEEQQQKITETADKIKQKLSCITEEEFTHFWEDDFSVFSTSGSKEESTSSKGIPELRHEPAELNLSSTDFRDIGRVDLNNSKTESADPTDDANDIEITFEGEATSRLESTNDEITIINESVAEEVEVVETVIPSDDRPVKLSEDKNHGASDSMCNLERSDSCADSREQLTTVRIDDKSENLVTRAKSVESTHEPPKHLERTSTPTSVPHVQDTLQADITQDQNVVQTVSDVDKNTTEKVAQISDKNVVHTPSSTPDVQFNVVCDPQPPTCSVYNEGHQSEVKRKLNNPPDFQPRTFNGSPRFVPRIPGPRCRWTFPQNGKNPFPRGPPQALPVHGNRMPQARHAVPFPPNDMVPVMFDPRAPPPFTPKIPATSHDSQRHPLLPFSSNDLPPSFDPSEPPPNVRPMQMPEASGGKEMLQPVPVFGPRNQPPPNVSPSKVDILHPPPAFDPRGPPPRIPTMVPVTNEKVPAFNPQQRPPKIPSQEDILQPPPAFDPRLTSQERSNLIVHPPLDSTGSSVLPMNLMESPQIPDFNMTPVAPNFSQLPPLGIPPPQPFLPNMQMNFRPALPHASSPQIMVRDFSQPPPSRVSAPDIQLPPPLPKDPPVGERTFKQEPPMNMDDGLEDMQEAMEFAKQVMNMTEEIESNSIPVPVNPPLPQTAPNTSKQKEDVNVQRSASQDDASPIVKDKSKSKENKSKKASLSKRDVAKGSEGVSEKQGTEKTVAEKSNVSVQSKVIEDAPSIDDQIRPKVIFNLNTKSKKIGKPDEWHYQDEEARRRRQRYFKQLYKPSESSQHGTTRDHEEKTQTKKYPDKWKNNSSKTAASQKEQLLEAETVRSEETSHSRTSTPKSVSQSPQASPASTTSSSHTSVQKLQRFTKQITKMQVPSSESSWKDRVINRFLRMSKNDICNMVNNSSLRKFDIAMKHLVKEKRSSFSLEMRNTEDEKMKGYDREKFMNQLNAMLDPGAVVDITNLPTEFIHHLSEVLQLDPMPFDSESPVVRETDSVEVESTSYGNVSVVVPACSTQENISVDSVVEPLVEPIEHVDENHAKIEKQTKLQDTVIEEPSLPSTSSAIMSEESTSQVVQQEEATMSPTTSNIQPVQAPTLKDQEPLFNIADLDDIFSVVTERTKQVSKSASPQEFTKSTVETQKTGTEMKDNTDISRHKNNSPPSVERVTDLEDIFSAGIAEGKLFNKTAELEQQPRSRKSTSEDRCAFQPEKRERWNRKERQDPDAFRNLTKEEWEAKYGRSMSSAALPLPPMRRSGSNSSDNSLSREQKRSSQRHCLSDSPKRRMSMSPVPVENTTSSSDRSTVKYNGFEETQRTDRSQNNSGSESSSSSDQDEETIPPDVTKLLKVIKEKEKIAKKRSINETIRDEVTAEIEKQWMEKSKHKERRSRKREKKKKDKKEKRKKDKKKKRKKSFQSSSSESEENVEPNRLLTEDEIKKEVVIKQEPEAEPEEHFMSGSEFGSTSAFSLIGAKTIATVATSSEYLCPQIEKPVSVANCSTEQIKSKRTTASPVIQPKTKAQLKQMPESSNLGDKHATEEPPAPVVPPSVDQSNTSVGITDNEKVVESQETNQNCPAIMETEGEQKGKDISTNNNSLQQIDVSLSIAKLACGDVVEDESVDVATSNQESERTLSVRSTSPEERVTANKPVSSVCTTSMLETEKNKGASKKIDIKAYKERALQKRLKEQDKIKEFEDNPTSLTQDLLNIQISNKMRAGDGESKKQEDSSHQESLGKDTKEKTQTKHVEESTKLKSKERKSDRSMDYDFNAIRDPVKSKRPKSDVESDTSNRRSKSPLDYKSSRDKYSKESSVDASKFKYIKSEGSKEMKLKKEKSKKSLETKKKLSKVDEKYSEVPSKKKHVEKHSTSAERKPISEKSQTSGTSDKSKPKITVRSIESIIQTETRPYDRDSKSASPAREVKSTKKHGSTETQTTEHTKVKDQDVQEKKRESKSTDHKESREQSESSILECRDEPMVHENIDVTKEEVVSSTWNKEIVEQMDQESSSNEVDTQLNAEHPEKSKEEETVSCPKDMEVSNEEIPPTVEENNEPVKESTSCMDTEETDNNNSESLLDTESANLVTSDFDKTLECKDIQLPEAISPGSTGSPFKGFVNEPIPDDICDLSETLRINKELSEKIDAEAEELIPVHDSEKFAEPCGEDTRTSIQDNEPCDDPDENLTITDKDGLYIINTGNSNSFEEENERFIVLDEYIDDTDGKQSISDTEFQDYISLELNANSQEEDSVCDVEPPSFCETNETLLTGPSTSTPMKDAEPVDSCTDVKKTEESTKVSNKLEPKIDADCSKSVSPAPAALPVPVAAACETPKKLNIRTKAALKESIDNLFIPSTNLCTSESSPGKSFDAKSKVHPHHRHQIPQEVSNSTTVEPDRQTPNNLTQSSPITKKSSPSNVQPSPVVELEKLKDLNDAVKKKDAEKTDVVDTTKKLSKKEEEDALHKVRNKQKMKRKQQKRRNITEKKVKEAIKSNTVQIGHPSTKEAIMARMIEIDVEIHKLMTEKMTLYQMLESDSVPAETTLQLNNTAQENQEEETITIRPRTPSVLMSQLIQNIEVCPVVTGPSTSKGNAENTPSKESTNDSVPFDKAKTPSRHEHTARKRNSFSYSSDDEEVMHYTGSAKSPVFRRKKKQKTERGVRWEDAPGSSVSETSVERKQTSDATKSILKRFGNETRQETVEQGVGEGEKKRSSSSLSKCTEANEPDDKAPQKGEWTKNDQKGATSEPAVQTDKKSPSGSNKTSARPRSRTGKKISSSTESHIEKAIECPSAKLQEKKSRDEPLHPQMDEIDEREMEMLNVEGTRNLSPRAPESTTPEKLSIYSDDSTWDSFQQNAGSDDQKKPNTGLALLEETYKKEMAKTRKLKAETRKKKKRQLEHLLKSVNYLTSEEEELPLSTLYIKKLQQKKDLLDSLEERGEEGSADPKVWQNVVEVINAVAENRVEDLYTPQSEDQLGHKSKTQTPTVPEDLPPILLDKDRTISDSENTTDPKACEKVERIEDLAPVLEMNPTISVELHIDPDIYNEVKDDRIDDAKRHGTLAMSIDIPQEENSADSFLNDDRCVQERFMDNLELSNIKASSGKVHREENIKNDNGKMSSVVSVENACNVQKNASDTESETEEIVKMNVEGKIEGLSLTTESVGCSPNVITNVPSLTKDSEEKEENVDKDSNVSKNPQIIITECVDDKTVPDIKPQESNSEAKDSTNEKSEESTGSQENNLTTERQNQEADLGSLSEQSNNIPKTESVASTKEQKSSRRLSESFDEEHNLSVVSTSSLSVVEITDTSRDEDVQNRRIVKRKRHNSKTFPRRSSRYGEETVKRVRLDTDNTQASEQDLEESHLQIHHANKSPTPLSSYDEEAENTPANSRRNRTTQKTQRKRSMHSESDTSSAGQSVMSDDTASATRLVQSTDTTIPRHEAKHMTKRRKQHTTLQMMNCEVRLVDSKYTILRPNINPNVLRRLGISTINPYVRPKSTQVNSTPSQQVLLEETPNFDTNRMTSTVQIAQEQPSKSISQSDEAVQPTRERVGPARVKRLQKSQKTNLIPEEVCEQDKPDVQIISTHTRDEIVVDVSENCGKPDIEIVEEKKAVTKSRQQNETGSVLSVIEAAEEKELPRTQYTIHKGPILDIKVFGNSFLAASEDGTIYRYSQASNGILNVYKGHKSAVTCLHVYTTGFADLTKEWMFSGSLDGTLCCYNIMTGVQMRDTADVGSPVQCMDQAWGVIFIGTKSGHVLRYHIKSGVLKENSIQFSDKSVLALKATNEGPRRVLIVASRSQPITIRDAQSGLFLRTICGQRSHTVYSLMRDNNLIYCGTSSTSIPVFDFTNGEQTMQYDAGVGIVCMRLYQQLLFAGCYDGNIYVFDTKDHRLICSIPGPGNMLLSMEIVDNKIIAGSKDKRLHSWQMPAQVRALLRRAT